MTRRLLVGLGIVEWVVAIVLAWLAWRLPGGDEVALPFEAVERIGVTAQDRIAQARADLDEFRTQDVIGSASEFAEASRELAGWLSSQSVDVEELTAIRDALDGASTGIRSLGRDLDPEAIEALARGLDEAASALETTLIPAVASGRDELVSAGRRLEEQARRLAALGQETPIDLSALADLASSLEAFDRGLEATEELIDPTRLEPIRDATEGAEGVVDEGARLAERAGSYTYPVVTMRGLRPQVRQQPFWPGGARVGRDLRKISRGLDALRDDLASMTDELPRIRGAITASRSTLAQTRALLTPVIAARGSIEALLNRLPATLADLAARLPGINASLVAALADLDWLVRLADALDRTAEQVGRLGADWPSTCATLDASARVLESARDRIDEALAHREAFETAQQRMADLVGRAADWTPELASHWERRLEAEDRALAQIDRGLDDFRVAVPEIHHAARITVDAGRTLAVLLALVALIHGAITLGSARQATPSRSAEPSRSLSGPS